ncbi:SURF1 family protein [Ornithinimicrobium cerasi]|uniref:SURF1-like protein n=1 Tax=Ornithinimicrobium cerasi TaxID=2248773 RepID=A0A285VK76_9MICO|nr:SURF1 family protein [Ornithinimicrobium cerasi]SOC54490.1 Cytochrome oxidase assembly protein ShyY1 [Ornithinimicrobium cerasi]
MLAVLRRPRWIAYLLLAVLFGVATANLGLWQWYRHEEKVERRDLVEANYDAAAVPVDVLLPDPDGDFPGGEQWRRVEARGTYRAGEQHLVRNRPHRGVFGYEVLVPLDLGDGTAVAVDRGWVRNAATAATLPDVPEPPAGEVTVSGWLRPAEPDLGRDLPTGQLASVDLDRLAGATGLTLLPGYLVLGDEQPAPPTRPELLEPPDTGLGSHFAYALQWWLTVPVGLVLVLVMARQTARDEAEQAGTLPRSEPRSRRVRIWDEEDA